jgi:hypothetical protein
MKKNIITIFITVSFFFGITGCAGFLEENPKDQMTEEILAESPEQLYLSTVANLYNEIGGTGGGQGLAGTDRGIYDLNTFTTDDAMLPTRGGDWYDGGLWQGLFKHEWGTKNDLVKASWDYLYRVIGMTNQSLDKLNASVDANPEVETYKSYQSEVRAVRALFYYYLLDMFARVPIVTSVDTKIADVTQSERLEVFNFVKKELEESIPTLSTAHSNLQGEYYGRLTKAVAYFLMAKLALNAEVYTDNDWTDDNRPEGKSIKFTVDGVEKNAWEATVAYCDKITELGYVLEPDFKTNFSINNETSRENIFIIPMDPTLYSARNYNMVRSRHYEHGKAINNQAGWNGSSATKEALTVFGYGTPSVDPRFDLTYYAGPVYDLTGAPVSNGDKGNLVYVPEAIKLDLSNDTYEKEAGARMKKYEPDPNAQEQGNLQHNDYVLFRYADVLLMKSEALVRNGQNGNGELSLVRNRVNASNDRPATLVNILDERLLELAWEGVRRQDLVRFDQFNKAISDRPATGKYLNVFPIHEDVLSLNKKLTQNPGY